MDVGGRNLDLLNSDQNGHCIQQIESEVDVGGFEPPASSLQTKHSSN